MFEPWLYARAGSTVVSAWARTAPRRAALVEAIDRARGGDPLAPVVVAVPTALAGVTLRRGVAAERGGIANVHFTSLPQLTTTSPPVRPAPVRRPRP